MPLLGGLAGCQTVSTGAPAVSTGGRTTALPAEKLTDRVTVISGAPGNVVALSSPEGVLLVDSGSAALAGSVRGKSRGRQSPHCVQHPLSS